MKKLVAISALLISLFGCYKFVESIPTLLDMKTAIVDLGYDAKNQCCPDIIQSK